MANNLIQLKRSNTSPTPANTLTSGELAFSYNSNSLFIGAQTGISAAGYKIGGSKYNFLDQATQGALTANAAQIVDANAFISNTYTSGLFVATSIASPVANSTAALITSISPQANSTQIGAAATGANTELATTWAIKTYVDGKVAGAGAFSNGTAYTWSAVQTFTANVAIAGNTTSLLQVGSAAANATVNATVLALTVNSTASATVNSTTFNVTNGTSRVWMDITGVDVGNTAANAVLTAASLSLTVNSTASATVNSTAHATTNGTAFSNVTVAGFQTSAGTLNVGNTAANAVVNASSLVVTVNSTASALINSTAFNVTNGSSTTTATSANLTTPSAVIGGQVVANSTIVNFGTVANLIATSAQLNVRDIVASGNLTVQGTTTTIDTTTLQVKDNFILLADQQSNTTTFTDTVDSGLYIATGNTGTTFFSGLARVAASSSNSNPYFKLFQTGTSPNNTIIDTSANTGTLQAFLRPYGTGTGFVANATNVTITANASVAVSITANSITLGTPLAATSGGTGQGSYTTGDMLYASSGTALAKVAIGTTGTVLQANSSGLPQFDTLDGGTF